MEVVDLGRWRFVGIAIIALTLAAIVLLLVGQGPVVAAAAIVGLILGLVAGAVGLFWLRRDLTGRSVSLRNVVYDGTPPDDAFMEHMRASAEVGGMDLGPVEAVRPVVQTVEVRGIRLQLVTIDERTAGATLTFEARGSIGARTPMGMAVVRVTDDLGTRYQAATEGQSGSTFRTRFEVSLAPAPPPSARVLTVTVEGFMEFDPWSRKSIEGPWVFEVPLVH